MKGAKLREVRRLPLRIQQNEAPGAKALHQGHECDLGCIRLIVEHAFAKKGAAERHPIEPACQFMADPRFHAVRVAFAMELMIACDYLIGDPGRTVRHSTRFDDVLKILIERDLESS